MIPFCFSAARHLRGWMEPGGRYPFGLRTCNLWPRRVAEKQKQGGARRGSIDMPPLPGFDLDGGSEGRKVIPLKTAKNRRRRRKESLISSLRKNLGFSAVLSGIRNEAVGAYRQ